jgi:hypothetical protein
MPIPTEFDRSIAAIEDLATAVLTRLRIFYRAGANRDPAAVREALQAYADAVIDCLNGELDNHR